MIKKIKFEENKMNLKTKIIILTFLFFSIIYLVDKFFDTYTFVSPIKKLEFQFILKKREQPKIPLKNQSKNGKNKEVNIKPVSLNIEKKSHEIYGKETQKKVYQTISTNKREEINAPNIKEYPKFMTEQSFNLRKEILSYLDKKIKSKNELIAFDNIIKKESGYNPTVINEIGAGGLCQAYPYSKMPCNLSWKDWQCQVDWCLKYIENRYENSINAWNFHLVNNWF